MARVKKTSAKKRKFGEHDPKTLTDKERAFVLYYLGECRFNAYQSAIKAGYVESVARSASTIVWKPTVQALIREHLDRSGLTKERIKIELGKIAFGADLADFEKYEDGKISLEMLRDAGINTSVLKSVTIMENRKERTVRRKVELWDKQAALNTLAKIQGMYSDVVVNNIIPTAKSNTSIADTVEQDLDEISEDTVIAGL